MRKKLTGADVKSAAFELSPLALRQILPLSVVACLIWAIRDDIQNVDLTEVFSRFSTITPAQWLLAAFATFMSFCAIGQYDRTVHGVLKTGIAPASTSKSGMTAVAVSQFVGFGLLSGTLVRWRMLPDRSPRTAFKVTLFVSASFLFCWIAVVCAADLATGAVSLAPVWVNVLILLLAATLVALPVISGRWPETFPSSKAMLSLFAATLLDLFFAALAFWALLPPGLDAPPGQVMTVAIVAFMAGLILATPGGIGPFEFALIALLPSLAEEPVLAAAFAFRVVYYAIPAAIAGFCMIFGQNRSDCTGNAPCEPVPPGSELEQTLSGACFAEAGLVRQRKFGLTVLADGAALAVARPGQSVVCLSRPLSGSSARPVIECAGILSQGAKPFLLYKAPPRLAVSLRREGWVALRTASEAIVDTANHDLAGPRFRQLRRMLRKCDELTVSEPGPNLPTGEMAQVNAAWISFHGAERGFTMGMFDTAYLARQRVFCARRKGRLIGFASFHVAQGEWALDIMRHIPDAPCGTMHMIVHHAIRTARSERVGRVLLAAVPDFAPSVEWWLNLPPVGPLGGRDGLRRFKTAFAPRWEPRYAVAPGRYSLFAGLLDTYRAVHARRPQDPVPYKDREGCRGPVQLESCS